MASKHDYPIFSSVNSPGHSEDQVSKTVHCQQNQPTQKTLNPQGKERTPPKFIHKKDPQILNVPFSPSARLLAPTNTV